MRRFSRTVFILMTLFFSTWTLAAPTAWQIIPDKSHLTFTATQNNSPLMGQFTTFTGDINFDPNQLATSHVTIVVDIASIKTSYAEVADTLKTPDWFDVKVFPKAIFKTKGFKKLASGSYQADGTLTIRDKTMPIPLQFTFVENATGQAVVKGSTTFKRTLFGVGRGEWSKTDALMDDVVVNFDLMATSS